MPRNPFTILGLPPDATLDAIKVAWRKLARENHPDVAAVDGKSTRRANRAMAEINAAYQELRDPEKRRIHRAAAAREAREARSRGDGAAGAAGPAAGYAADRAWDGGGPYASPIGGTPPPRPITGRIDTSAVFRPRNAVLHPVDRSVLPGLSPRPRYSEEREPPRASTPSGPTVVRPGPNFETELPRLIEALDTELRFGKFAGLTLADVAELEPTYIDWIVRTIDRDPELLFAARVVLRELERSGIVRRQRFYSANQHGSGPGHLRRRGAGPREPPTTGYPMCPRRRPKVHLSRREGVGREPMPRIDVPGCSGRGLTLGPRNAISIRLQVEARCGPARVRCPGLRYFLAPFLIGGTANTSRPPCEFHDRNDLSPPALKSGAQAHHQHPIPEALPFGYVCRRIDFSRGRA
jgi:hypothetical protein